MTARIPSYDAKWYPSWRNYGTSCPTNRGEGGGHDGAAGWSGKTDRIAAESSFIAQVALIPRSEN